MYRTLILLTLLGISYANPAPKVDTSEWGNILQIGGDVKIKPISTYVATSSSERSIDDKLESFITSNEFTFPVFGSTVTFDGRKLVNDEFDLNLKLSSETDDQARRKKSKIKKIITPLLTIIVLKAITLIPLALGILGIKTWNALQLSFISFVSSIAIAVWKLCSKFSEHPPHPHIFHESLHDVHDVHHPHVDLHHSHVDLHDHHHHLDHAHLLHNHHDHWDHRSDEAQKMAYNGYVQDQQQ